ncbi:heparinase II/III family protein [Roseomonas sp. SSH11]|uniref:Heparinase II/III family protein n=1 Tax=Pararoseomonas baculiformis TaxID=2820812 RepID=A0ABS4AH18_9PROT|nr:heparinase II/III family protein [Pararoseomonas baculiformis]MBP0446324.1 heparinase II/III family protein [Pararoseomonas baculiformis]
MSWLRGARRTLSGLKPVRVPESPSRAFRDLWPGDALRGQRLLTGELEVSGTTRPLPDDPSAFGPAAGSPAWRAALHGFVWLRDLRALGTDTARMHARDITRAWMEAPGADPVAHSPEVTGARLSAWLGHWDFVAATAEDGFRRAMMARLAADARNLVASLPAESRHRGALVALKGALAAAVALEEEPWLTRCLKLLPAEIDRQILPDGAHVERSPGILLLALQDLIEIRNLLHGAGIEAPPHLAHALDRAAPALRLFRHGDGGLACFNSTREETASLLDLVLTQAQARGRAPLILGDAGFQRLQAGRTLVIADCGPPPPRGGGTTPGGLPRGADRQHHAGTLSFEMSVGRDRLIINCGSAPAAEGAWRDALRATAAHSTLTLADTNSSELTEDGLGRRPEHVEAERHEASGAQWLEATHDGWKKGFNAIHRRRLYLAESGDDLRGEDLVEAEEIPSFTVRFHLHPAVTATMQEDGSSVLLRLPSGAAWRLRARGGRMAVEDSVQMFGEAKPTTQVVVSAEAGSGHVQWAIGRVAPAEG